MESGPITNNDDWAIRLCFPGGLQNKLNFRIMVIKSLLAGNQAKGTPFWNIVKFIESNYQLNNIYFHIKRILDWMIHMKIISKQATGNYVLSEAFRFQYNRVNRKGFIKTRPECNAVKIRPKCKAKNWRSSAPRRKIRCSKPKPKSSVKMKRRIKPQVPGISCKTFKPISRAKQTIRRGSKEITKKKVAKSKQRVRFSQNLTLISKPQRNSRSKSSPKPAATCKYNKSVHGLKFFKNTTSVSKPLRNLKPSSSPKTAAKRKRIQTTSGAKQKKRQTSKKITKKPTLKPQQKKKILKNKCAISKRCSKKKNFKPGTSPKERNSRPKRLSKPTQHLSRPRPKFAAKRKCIKQNKRGRDARKLTEKEDLFKTQHKKELTKNMKFKPTRFSKSNGRFDRSDWKNFLKTRLHKDWIFHKEFC